MAWGRATCRRADESAARPVPCPMGLALEGRAFSRGGGRGGGGAPCLIDLPGTRRSRQAARMCPFLIWGHFSLLFLH